LPGVGIADSARIFIRGPVWVVGGSVSIIFSLATVAELLRDASATRILALVCIALAALVVASFWSFHRNRMEMEARKESLPRQIDDLQREGGILLAELQTPVEPERKGGVTTISGEWAPEEWWDKVEAFEQRIRDLFIARFPALLSDYANGANEYLRRRREANEAEAGSEARSDAEKMLAMANEMRSGPAKRMEASLEGLTVARHRLGSTEA
jgi:hypothetical protein